MSGSGSRGSMNNHCPNGRKRRLTSHRVKVSSSPDSNQPQLRFPPKKRPRTDDPELLDAAPSTSAVEMAHLPEASNNHKISLGNNFVKAGISNNHARKPGQGKKLVIKNRKGVCVLKACACLNVMSSVVCYGCMCDGGRG